MNKELKQWKPEDDLKTPTAQSEFILAAIEENDPSFLAQSLAVIARANGNPALGAVWDGFASILKALQLDPKKARRKTAKRELAMA